MSIKFTGVDGILLRLSGRSVSKIHTVRASGSPHVLSFFESPAHSELMIMNPLSVACCKPQDLRKAPQGRLHTAVHALCDCHYACMPMAEESGRQHQRDGLPISEYGSCPTLRSSVAADPAVQRLSACLLLLRKATAGNCTRHEAPCAAAAFQGECLHRADPCILFACVSFLSLLSCLSSYISQISGEIVSVVGQDAFDA